MLISLANDIDRQNRMINEMKRRIVYLEERETNRQLMSLREKNRLNAKLLNELYGLPSPQEDTDPLDKLSGLLRGYSAENEDAVETVRSIREK